MGSSVRSEHGRTPQEVADYLRISPDRVRLMILRGQLGALDQGQDGRHRYVVLPEHLRDYEQRKTVVPQPRRKPGPKRKTDGSEIDYYPD